VTPMVVRVLMLDDDTVHLELSQKFLSRQSREYEIVTAETSSEAMTKIDAEEFDAAVCDIDLGAEDLSGLDVLEHIRSEGRDTPVIIFTGKSREEFAIQALNLGADYYLRKSATNIENLYAELSYYILTAVEKRRTKKALTETEIRAQTYLDTAGTVIIAFDKDLRITMVNRKACEVLETPEDRLLGRSWISEFIPAKDKQHIESYLRDLLAGNVSPDQKEEGCVLTPSGEKAIEWYDALLRDASGNVIGIVSAGPEITERKRAESLLREERDKAQTYLDLADAVLLALDREFNVTMINRKGSSLLEMEDDEVIGMNWIDSFVVRSRRDEVREYLERLLERPTGTGPGCVMEIQTRTGKTASIECHDRVVCNEEGVPVSILCSARQITFKAGADYSGGIPNEEMFRTVFEESPICIEVFDSSGILVAANKAALDLFGVTEEADFIGLDLFADPNTPDYIIENLKNGAAVRAQTIFDFAQVKLNDLYKTSKSGLIHLDTVFSPMRIGQDLRGYVAHIQDVTDKHKAEQELMQSRERFRELYSNALTGLFRIRASDSMVLECNDQFARLLGHDDRSELIEEPSFFRSYLTKAGLWDRLKEECRHTERIRTELGLTQKDGGRLWLRLSLRAAPEKGYLEGVIADITQERNALELLEKQKTELSEFAHSMSHDLKNILHNMTGFIELAEDENDLKHLVRLKSLIHDAGELLDHSVLLAEAGMVVEDTEEVELDTLMRDVANSLVPENVEYMQDTLPSVRGDRNKVGQIFRNLIDNAITHGKPSRIEVRSESTDGFNIITVANDGKQIPEPIRHKIFQRGFTTAKSGKGFGLTIVKRLVEAHGWTIRLSDSRETAFELRIPRVT
jgi:PAS domain S-box-containing protein